MKNKIAIVTDSTADFPAGMANDLGIYFSPVHVFVNGKDHLDGISITKAEVINHLKEGSEVYTTPPTPHEYARIYEKLLAKYERVISFHVSSQVSDCYKSAKNSAKLLYEEEEQRIEFIDTGNMSAGQALLIKKGTEIILKNGSSSGLYKRLQYYMQNCPICFTVGDLKWLRKGGRINAVSAMMGSLLNIKPVIGMVKNELKPVGKYRGKKSAVKGMIKKADQLISNMKDGYDIWISHIDDEEDAEYMKGRLAESLEKNIEEIKTVEIGSTIAAHAGPGCCGWAILPN